MQKTENREGEQANGQGEHQEQRKRGRSRQQATKPTKNAEGAPSQVNMGHKLNQ